MVHRLSTGCPHSAVSLRLGARPRTSASPSAASQLKELDLPDLEKPVRRASAGADGDTVTADRGGVIRCSVPVIGDDQRHGRLPATGASAQLTALNLRHQRPRPRAPDRCCLLYTSDAADERSSVDLGGRRIIKKKK